MEQEATQVVQAILVASNPTQGSLHQQALEFLSTVQSNANETWRLGLALFVDVGPDGARKHPPQARFFGLRILEDFLEHKYEPLDEDSFRTLQQGLVSYIQSEYVYGPAETSASCEITLSILKRIETYQGFKSCAINSHIRSLCSSCAHTWTSGQLSLPISSH